ncbi:hypothetical protein ACFYXM_33970 [Streptomyces sp. NPDC002476]|uniref:hypothetical protein n=1 Tax=Streptomyces sp. NPDC002476 TaxID=3364648 RepID=UPI00369DBF28
MKGSRARRQDRAGCTTAREPRQCPREGVLLRCDVHRALALGAVEGEPGSGLAQERARVRPGRWNMDMQRDDGWDDNACVGLT